MRLIWALVIAAAVVPPPLLAEDTSESPEPESTSFKDLMPEFDPGEGEKNTGEAENRFEERPEWMKEMEEGQSIFTTPEEDDPVQTGREKQVQRPNPSPEELEKLRKEKNWLVEEWMRQEEERKQIEAELAAEREQTLIDLLVEQEEEKNPEASGENESNNPGDLAGLAPALPPVSWDRDRDNEFTFENESGTMDYAAGEEALSESLRSFESEETGSGLDPANPFAFSGMTPPGFGNQGAAAPERNSAEDDLPKLQLTRPTGPDSGRLGTAGLGPESDPNTLEPAFDPFTPVAAFGPDGLPTQTNPAFQDVRPGQRLDAAQYRDYSARIEEMRRQELQRQAEKNDDRPQPSDFDPLQRKIFGNSRFSQ